MAEGSARSVTNFTVDAPEYSKHVISYKTILDEIRGIAPIINGYGYLANDEGYAQRWVEETIKCMPRFTAVGDFLFKPLAVCQQESSQPHGQGIRDAQAGR